MPRWRDGTETPSTPSTPWRGKIGRPPQGKAQRRAAPPHPSAKRLGMSTPHTIRLEWKGGAEGWVMVSDHRGRAFFPGDITLVSLIERLTEGGYKLAD